MKGIVVKSTGSWYSVNAENGINYKCRIAGKIKLDDLKLTNPIAVGDEVTIELEKEKLRLEIGKGAPYAPYL